MPNKVKVKITQERIAIIELDPANYPEDQRTTAAMIAVERKNADDDYMDIVCDCASFYNETLSIVPVK